ncbi:MAG TPA: hypothetical protein PKY50_08465 [Candidatus Competibacter sp.]|nr:hypothetical protein [Candidatus Competibacter sp.]
MALLIERRGADDQFKEDLTWSSSITWPSPFGNRSDTKLSSELGSLLLKILDDMTLILKGVSINATI